MEKQIKEDNSSIFRVMVARIRHSTHNQLVQLAENDTKNSGRHIYVADLVREAIKIYLKNRVAPKAILDGQDDNQLNV